MDELLERLKRRKKQTESEKAGGKGAEEETGAQEEAVSTQFAPPLPQNELQRAKEKLRERFTDGEMVSIPEILASDGLKTCGIVVGYVAKVVVDGRITHIVITDGKHEINCSVHPEVAKSNKIEKNALIALKSPSVWRVPHTKYNPTLNITHANVLWIEGRMGGGLGDQW